MYNINKYRFIFFGCLAIIFLFLFMNSTKIVEGATTKKKSSSSSKKKSTPVPTPTKTQDTSMSEATINEATMSEATMSEATMSEVTMSGTTTSGATTSGATPSESVKPTSKKGNKTQTSTDNKIREQVNKILPSMLANAISPAINEIKKTQETLNLNMKTVDEKMGSFNTIVENSNKSLDDKTKLSTKELSESVETLSTNLSQQYDMYKNGIQNEATTATKTISNLKEDIAGASDDVMKAKTETKQYSDLSKQIYDNVFGAISARIVKQDNSEYAKESFTDMNDGGYVSKNLFDLEKNVIDEINNFNTIYYEYVRCKASGTITCLETDDDIITASTSLNNAIDTLKTEYENAGITGSSSTFSANHQDIKTKSQEIDNLRRTLDSKMESILKGNIEVKKELDSTVYAGIMWSVLATSLLFFVFS